MQTPRTRRLSGLLAALAVGIFGCGTEEAPVPATISSFAVSEASVTVGEPVTLSWVTENATELAITYGNGLAVDLAGADLTAGEVDVLIENVGEYTFTLTAQGEAGADATTATADVTVAPHPDPVIESFAADPATITVGETLTLTWDTTHAESVVITEEGGDEVLNTAVEPDGSIDLTPAVDTTYTLTATGAGGNSVTATAAVTVLQLPVVDSFTATSGGAPVNQPVISGTEVVLAWETTHVTEVTLTDSHGTSYPVTDVDGSLTVTPSVTTTFTLGVTAPGGNGTSELTVDVLATVNAFTVASAEGTGASAVVRSGDEITLSWATEGATSLTLTGPDGFSYSTTDPAEMAAGTVTDTPATSGTYDLLLEPTGTFSSDSVSVEVTDAPRIRTASVDEAVITAGESVNVSWTADGAETILITATSGALDPVSVDTSAVTPAGDTVAVTLPAPGDWTITLEAGNSLTTESHTKALAVQALAVPAVVAFDVQPRRTASGGDVVVSWETQDAASVALKKDGIAVETFPSDQLTGTYTDTLTITAAYVLEAKNALGYVTTSQAVTVTAGAPEIVSFTSNLEYVAVDSPLTLSWQVEGGRSLSVSESGVDVCSSTDYAEISDGSCTVTTPATTGQYTYTLTVVDGAEQVTADVTVQVSDGPIITDFYASSSIITAGSNVTLGIVVTADAAGTEPTVSLVDQDANDYSDQVAYNATDDVWEITLTPADGADYTFTATAHTDGTTDSTATLNLTVAPVPEVVNFTASNAQIDTISGPFDSELAWETTGAVTVRVYELDDTGAAVGSPLVETSDTGTVALGTLTVAPSVTTSYRVEAENLAGVLATDDLTIQVDLPLISQFEWQDENGNLLQDALDSQAKMLAWTTTRADSVVLSPSIWSAVELTDANTTDDDFVDISTSPTATEIGATMLSDSDDFGETTVTFPSGFAFPFFGEDETEVIVDTDGIINFDGDDVLSGGGPMDNSNGTGSVALFWDDLDLDDGSNTTVWWDSGSDAIGDYVVIMYKNISFGVAGENPSDLNFEVFLYDTGLIGLRYGDMTSADADAAMGDGATIGWAAADGSEVFQWHFEEVFPGGFAHRSWLFDPRLPPSATISVSTTSDLTATLTAINSNGESSAEATVTVWSDLTLVTPTISVTQPTQVGDDTTIRWDVPGATSVEVLDDTGAVVGTCTSGGDRIAGAASSCTVVPAATGDVTYTLSYSNLLSADTTDFTFSVDPRLAIESFTANGAADELIIGLAEPVTLAWDVTGVALDTTNNEAAFALLDDAKEFVAFYDAATFPAQGSVVVTPSETTTYSLYISDTTDFTGRMRYAAITVWVNDTAVTDFTTSTTQTWSGGDVTLNWSAGSSSSDAQFTLQPGVETLYGQTYNTISDDPAAVELAMDDYAEYLLDFSDVGFQVPFDGEVFDTFLFAADGYVSFGDANTYTTSGNDPMPDDSTPNGILAAYWDDLEEQDGKTEDTARLYYKLSGIPGRRTLVFEWYDVKKYSYSDTYDGTLNFQAVLHEDGKMEIRYGEMRMDDPAQQHYAVGDSASAGWENLDGTNGYEIVYNDERPDLIGNGITHVFYPPEVASSGSRVVHPVQDTTYTMCAAGGGYQDCQDVFVDVVAAGDVMITELMIDPVTVGDANGEWVEVRNVSRTAIDVQGWVLTDGAGSFTIPSGTPVMVQPGEHLVFARGDATVNGGFTPDFVWTDPNLDLDDEADTVQLLYGPLVVDEVSYASTTHDSDGDGTPDGTWLIDPDVSIVLDSSVHAGGATVNDAWEAIDADGEVDPRWCLADVNDVYATGLQGSPGSVGYGCRLTYYDVDLFGGGTHGWIDISGTGTPVPTVVADEAYTQIASGLGFTTSYFGTSVSDLWISSNGFLTFVPLSNADYTNSNLPYTYSTDPVGVVAPFWESLKPNEDDAGNPTSNVYVQTMGTAGDRVTIVQWDNWTYDSTTHNGTMNFQAQIYENGDIVFAYGPFEMLENSSSTDYSYYYRGKYATVGIENIAEDVGLVYSYNTDNAVWDGLTLLFRKRP